MNLIHIITKGKRNYFAYGKATTLETGNVLLIPHGTKYITRTEQETSGIGVCFDLSDHVRLIPGVYGDWSDKHGEFLYLFQNLHESLNAGVKNELHCQSILLRILDKMNRENESNISLRSQIEPALRYIENHCCENVSVAEYAAVCHLSESYFRRRFLQFTGMSPIDYRDSIRFRMALAQKAEGRSTTEIAANVGFCDASYFRKMFKRHFGMSFSDNEMPEFI